MRILVILTSIALFGVACTTSGSSAPTPSAAPVAVCGPFDHPLDALEAPHAGEARVAEGAGCGAGQITSNGTSFTVDSHSVWILYWASTCDGTYTVHPIEAALTVTAHNTVTGADLTPVVIWGPWGYGG